jgi:phytoene synthase
VSTLVPPIIADRIEAGRKASNLAFALRVLPPARRQDALIFYRFCRILDDIADEPDLSEDERREALEAWQRALSTEPQLLPPDIVGIIERNGVDRHLLLEILEGVRTDLTVRRYSTFEDVRQYCWRVASAVGLVSIRIFGCDDPASEAYAEALGLALQWTNILRDVGEDARNGRIYLPQDELERFGVSEEDILAGVRTEAFDRLIRFQAGRAKSFFAAARLPAADRRALVPAEIMRAIYSALLARMERDGFDVFAKRYRVPASRKFLLAAFTLLRK